MIKPNELRLGNWIAFGVNNVKVRSIWRDHILDDKEPHLYVDNFGKFKSYCFLSDQVDGIPLTPEILLKCGLTKVNDKEFEIEVPVEWSKTHHTDFFFKVKWYEYIATGDYHVGWRPWIQQTRKKKDEEIFLWGYLESVHQLQNYYFAFTGSELPINFESVKPSEKK